MALLLTCASSLRLVRDHPGLLLAREKKDAQLARQGTRVSLQGQPHQRCCRATRCTWEGRAPWSDQAADGRRIKQPHRSLDTLRACAMQASLGRPPGAVATSGTGGLGWIARLGVKQRVQIDAQLVTTSAARGVRQRQLRHIDQGLQVL